MDEESITSLLHSVVAETLGFSDDTLETNIRDIAKVIIEGIQADPKTLMSTDDLEELLDIGFGHIDGAEVCINKILNTFLERELVYEYKNKESYLSLVKAKGYISLKESDMSQVADENSEGPRNTEFPTDKKGYYVFT